MSFICQKINTQIKLEIKFEDKNFPPKLKTVFYF